MSKNIYFIIICALITAASFTVDSSAVSVGYDEFDYWEDPPARNSDGSRAGPPARNSDGSRAGTQTVRACRRYDSDGRLRQKIYYWKDGVTLQQEERYDLEGNTVVKIHYNANGRMQANVDGWAAMRASYEDKKPVVESFYGEDGKLVARKLYNKSGRLVARQMVGDQEFDPYEQFDARPAMGERVLYYDRSGNLKGATGGYSEE